MGEASSCTHLEYSTVRGYFIQDEPATDPTVFDSSQCDFGLIPQPYDTDADFDPDHSKTTQWERFAHKLDTLNRDAQPDVEFKLLFLGRHGQGVHNVAEEVYGREAWDCYWSLLEGDGTLTWADARLTTLGIKQAEIARDTWRSQMERGIPLPTSYYTSPLERCLATADITFGSLPLPASKLFIPTVKELLRETIGIHTCDRRSSRSTISHNYPTYTIEPGFSDPDRLWTASERESNSARTARLRELLDDIFAHDGGGASTYISLTAHGGAIESILEAVRHRRFKPPTGGVLPVLVRVEVRDGEKPPEEVEPPSGVPDCGADLSLEKGL